MKICNCCKTEKSLSYFKKLTKCYSLNCLECINIKNEERRKTKRLYQRSHYLDNKNYYKNYNKQYYKENKQYFSEYSKQYNIDNRESILDTRREYRHVQLATNPLFKLSENISGLIRNSLKNGGYSKNSKTYNILGCSFRQFMEHLNNNKYGFNYSDNLLGHLYDLDHIIPLSSATNEKEFIDLNNYKNFQLLPYEYNRYIKQNSPFDITDFETWLSNYQLVII